MDDTLADKIRERLEKLQASRKAHQEQLQQAQRTAVNLMKVIDAESGAIAELEALLE